MEEQKSITMKDVARVAGVSVGTVSRVINNEPGIKESTLEKVNAAIKELNYIPDVYARGMKKNKTETIALIIPTVWHPFLENLPIMLKWNWVRKITSCSFAIFLVQKELDYLTMLQQNKVDGIIAITYSPIDDYLSSNIPFVSIDRVYENKDIACVSSDNQAGAELAANTLIAKRWSSFCLYRWAQ